MVYIFIILCFIAVFVLWALIGSFNDLCRESAIAIIEDGKKINNELAYEIIDNLPVHWYIFEEGLTKEEKEIEIKDLKEHYKLVLEVK